MHSRRSGSVVLFIVWHIFLLFAEDNILRVSAFGCRLSPFAVRPNSLGVKRMAPSDDIKSCVHAEKSPGTLFFDDAIAAVGKSTSSMVALLFFAALAYKRDTIMLSFFIGAIGNGIASKVLKRVLNQDRPDHQEENDNINLKPSDKGMPSSHAMSLGFIVTFTALGLPFTAVPLVLYVLIALYYRVQTNLHTKEQVLVGLIFGTTNGVLWRDLTFGTSPFISFCVKDAVSAHLLPANGLLPVQYLLVPAIVGAAVVGSLERRISLWTKAE